MITYSKAIAGNTDLLTAQAFVYQEGDITLVILISAIGEDVFNAVRQTSLELQTTFFETQEALPQRINHSIESIKQKIPQATNLQILLTAWKQSPKELKTSSQNHGVVLYLKSQTFNQSSADQLDQKLPINTAFLLRSNELIQLVSEKELSQLVSGYLEDGDQLLFATETLTKNITPELLKKILQSPTEQIEDLIEDYIYHNPTSDPLAAVRVQLKSDPFTASQSIHSENPPSSAKIEQHHQQSEAKNPTPTISPPPFSEDLHSSPQPFANTGSPTETEGDKYISMPKISSQPDKQLTPVEQFEKEEEIIPHFTPKTTYEDNLDNSPTSFYSHKQPPFSIRNIFHVIKAYKKINKNLLLGLAIFALSAIIFLVGYFYLFNSSSNKSDSTIIASVNQIRSQYENAKSLKDQDPQKAKQELLNAQQVLQENLQKYPQNQQLIALKEEITQNSQDILKIYQVTDWPIFLTLDLIKKGFATQKLSLSLGKLLLLDQTQKTLVLINLKTKNNQILAGSNQLGNAKFAALNGDFAFTYSQDKGIIRVDTQNQKVTQAVKPDTEWGTIADIYGFGSNIYLLDSSNNQIWKYVPTESGYSDKNPYFKDQNITLSSSAKMHIDSSVWLTSTPSEIQKYTTGILDSFTIQGLDQPIERITSFFISDETESLYILDAQNSRVVILDKKGIYQSQYHSDKFKSAADLIVDEENKKIYLLENNVIYQIDLK